MIVSPRGRAAAAVAGALLLAFAVLWGIRQKQPEAPPRAAAASASPATLLLLTSLPLVFGEDFSVEGNGSPALNALQQRYRVVPISVASGAELAKGRLLLMAQAPGQPAENLVALDQWVRAGGRAMLLADPMLEWPSRRPLGDLLRPLPMYADTGLLAHWGLRLDAPDQRGPTLRRLGGYEVETSSPGTLSGRCDISQDRLVARCRIGKGQAIVIADADFLNVEDLDGPTDHNLDSLIAELASLEH
jgi:hypothetical protein